MRSRRPRPAFTLLEMMLALSIGLVLLGALYLTLNSQLMLAQAGREIVDEATLARALLTRLSEDITANLGPVDPRGLPEAQPEDMAVPEATEEEKSADQQAELMEGADSSMMASSENNTIVFNLGVRGESNWLMLSSSRMHRDFLRLDPAVPTGGFSDLRRVCWWFVEGKGLARREILPATSEGADLDPYLLPEQDAAVVAPEVTGLTIEYFDGIAWQGSWDGGGTAEDGMTPIGPPSAIRIVLTMRRPGAVGDDPEQRTVEYRHVVALPTGNNFPVASSTP